MTQMIRTDSHRTKIGHFKEQLYNQIKTKIGVEEAENMKEGELSNKDQQLFNLLSSFEDESTSLGDRIWVVYRNETKKAFYTSDNPTIGFNHGTFPKTEYEIFMPLTPKYMLSVLIKEQFPNLLHWNNTIQPMKDLEHVKFYNRLIVLRSSRQIYSNEVDFVFAKKIMLEKSIRDTKTA